MNQISGKVYYVSQTENATTKSNNNISNRELWLVPMYFDKYSGEAQSVADNEAVKIEFSGYRCLMLDTILPGDIIKVSYELRGRVYTDASNITKCITSVEGRFINIIQQVPRQTAPQPRL